MKIAVVTFLSALTIFAASGGAAEPPAPSSEPPSLHFRRVYVPENVKDWPKGEAKYLPMDAREFERLIGQIQRKSTRLPLQSAAGFIQSEFECRLSGDRQGGAPLLQGSGTLEVSPAIASGMLMSLEPCNLAIERAQWITSDGAPAVIGTSSDGHLQVLAERAGQMKFDWSLAGSRDSADATTFAIQLPPCAVNRMRIDLPAELLPAVDRGVVTDEGTVETGMRRWTVELGGWSACRLRLAKPGGEVQQPRFFLAEQSTAYDVSLRGLEVLVNLNVSAHLGTVRKLAVNLDPVLELLGIAAGGQSLPWSALPAQGGKWRRISVELPAALQDSPAKLRLRAIAPLFESESWKLPRIQVEGAICRTNTMRLAVESPLCLAALTPHGCRQTASSALKPGPGEQFDFQIDESDAEVEIDLTRRAADVRATCATATFLGQGKMSSRVVADFRAAEGPVFSLEAAVLPNWAIDSVATQPADALDDWAVDNRGGSRRLAFRLARPLTPARPLRLIVSARRLYAGAGRNVNVRLNMDDVVPLRFGAPVESRRLVDLRTSGAYEMRFAAGSQSWRADVKELTPAELDLFAEPPGEMLLHDNGKAANLRLVLTARKPSLSADIRLEAVISRGILEENYSFSCTPAKTAPIDSLVVHFTAHRDNPLSWSIDGLDETRLSARRWMAARTAAAGLTADEEVWEVALGNRRSMPFELRATRKTVVAPGAPGLPLCLVSLPDAAIQRGSVLVRSLGPQAVQVVARRADRLPIEAAPAGQVQTARAAYSYDPREEATMHPEPAIVVKCRESANPAAWAWDCDVRSHYAGSGAVDHLITYKIENAGCRQVNLNLPPLLRGDVREILINKKPASAYAADPAADRLTIELPGNVKDIDLSLCVSTSGAPLGTFQRLQPPLLDIGLPVLSRHWSVELPPGYETLSAGDDFTAGGDDSYNLRRRLLGTVGRSEEQKVFDPLRVSDWRDVLRPARVENRDNGTRRTAGTAGWSIYRTNLPEKSAYVTIVRRCTVDVAACLLFLAAVALGTWPRTGRPLVLTMVAILCGILALTAPAAVAGTFSGGLLGVAFCLLLALVRIPIAAASRLKKTKRELPSTLTNIIPYGAPVLAVALLCGGPAGAEPVRDAPAAHSVFIPVNDKHEATGGKYLVPEALFSELYRRDAIHVEKPQGWMIAQAAYRAALAEDVATRDYVVDQLTAEYEIRVFNAPARVRIPLHRDEVNLVPGRAQLDDRPVQPDWEADGSALFLDIAEPGEYRLELTLRPNGQPESGAQERGFDFAIPRVPTARLEITVPPGGPPVAIPTAHGTVRWEAIPSRWIAELGPADRLAARWQSASAAAEEPIDFQQLQWLRIEQGCVLLNVRLKAMTSSPHPRRLQVKADASLELLPDPAAAAQLGVTRGSDATQTIDCQLPPSPALSAATSAALSTASSSTSSLDLHFLCTAASSAGVFRAPQVEVTGSRPGSHWLAVSLDRSLGYQLRGGRAAEAGTVQEFMRNWGNGESAPDLAMRLNGNTADWSMTTHVRKAATSSDQKALWSFDSDEAQLRFDAELMIDGGSVFQYRLAVPPALHVDSLAVSGESVSGAPGSRWFENKDGHLTLFLGSATTGRQLLQLRGRLPIRQNHKFDLSQIRLEDVHITNDVIRLYRSPAVDVNVSAATGLTEIKAPEGGAAPVELGQLVRSYYADPAKDGTLTVSIKPLQLPPPPGSAAEVPKDAAPQLSSGKARVVAATVRCVVQADGCRIGAAVMDVESPAASRYPLVIPDGFQLLHLTVDGVPVDEAPEHLQELSVPILLHAPRSRVEMLYVANPVTPDETLTSKSRVTISAPRLADLPVERTAWIVAAPRGLEPVTVEEEGGSAGPDVASGDDVGDLAADWRQFAANSGTVVAHTFDDASNSITIGFREANQRNQSWWGAAALIVAAVLVVVLVRRGLLVDWVQRWPNIAGIVLGIAWWLWAAPSALGLATVAAILVRQAIIRLRRSRGMGFEPFVPSRGTAHSVVGKEPG